MMDTKLFKFLKPPQPPKKLKWKMDAEPELLAWSIRARNYNVFLGNILFFILTTLAATVSIIIYSVFKKTGQPWGLLWATFLFFVLVSLIFYGSHQKVNIAYRITPSGIEYCKWKYAIRLNSKLVGIISIFVTVAFLSLAITTSSLSLVALAGPGGMGVIALMRLSSKKFRDPNTEYNHLEFKWRQITQLAIATNRDVVDLKYTYIDDGHETHWNFNIFCEKGQKESVAAVIRLHLSPEVPFIRAKVNVPLSTE